MYALPSALDAILRHCYHIIHIMNEISNSLCISFATFNKNHKSIQSRMCVVHIKMLRSSIFPRVVLISAWLEIQARNAFYMHRYKLLYCRFVNICAGQQQMRTKISSTISNWILLLDVYLTILYHTGVTKCYVLFDQLYM